MQADAERDAVAVTAGGVSDALVVDDALRSHDVDGVTVTVADIVAESRGVADVELHTLREIVGNEDDDGDADIVKEPSGLRDTLGDPDALRVMGTLRDTLGDDVTLRVTGIEGVDVGDSDESGPVADGDDDTEKEGRGVPDTTRDPDTLFVSVDSRDLDPEVDSVGEIVSERDSGALLDALTDLLYDGVGDGLRETLGLVDGEELTDEDELGVSGALTVSRTVVDVEKETVVVTDQRADALGQTVGVDVAETVEVVETERDARIDPLGECDADAQGLFEEVARADGVVVAVVLPERDGRGEFVGVSEPEGEGDTLTDRVPTAFVAETDDVGRLERVPDTDDVVDNVGLATVGLPVVETVSEFEVDAVPKNVPDAESDKHAVAPLDGEPDTDKTPDPV